MPIVPVTLPLCAVCGAVLAPNEQEANLQLISTLIATNWPHPIRLFHLRCVTYGLQDDSEDDCPYSPLPRPGQPRPLPWSLGPGRRDASFLPHPASFWTAPRGAGSDILRPEEETLMMEGQTEAWAGVLLTVLTLGLVLLGGWLLQWALR